MSSVLEAIFLFSWKYDGICHTENECLKVSRLEIGITLFHLVVGWQYLPSFHRGQVFIVYLNLTGFCGLDTEATTHHIQAPSLPPHFNLPMVTMEVGMHLHLSLGMTMPVSHHGDIVSLVDVIMM